MNIIFTVCNRSSLTHALALADSVMQFPGSVFYLCWVDTIELTNLPANIKLLPISAIQIAQWEQMTQNYYDFELLPASRPWFAKHLMALHPENDSFIFLAPTVYVYQSLDKIVSKNSDMLVTPHITSALKKSSILDDKRILNIGMFHAGSWVLNKSQQSLAFLDWWAERTIDRAKFDLCNGMCLDQLWLNFVLVRIHNTKQIVNPGWHYGLHAVPNKKLEYRNQDYFIGDQPLVSADFAGLDFFDPIWSDHAALLGSSGLFRKLYSDYKKVLASFKREVPAGQPGYGRNPKIGHNRLLRKKLAGNLVSITRFIDQF